jgi:hypothetical protein
LSIRKLVSVLIVSLLGSSMLMAASKLPCSSTAEYRALLVHLSEELKNPDSDLREASGFIPSECDFSEGKNHFQFSMSAIQAELSGAESKSDKERTEEIRQLQAEVDRRLQGVNTYEHGVDSTVRPKLRQIFTHPEFRRVGKQDAEAVIKEKLMRWMMKLFSFIAKNPEQATMFAKVFVWTVCGLVVVLIGWRLLRWAMEEGPPEAAREYILFAPSAKSWKQWIEEAREARERGDLREAIHLSYWAAISYLESSGAWRPDNARTPREYLRLIARDNPAWAALLEITRTFEVTWYGERVPELNDCEAMLARVEQIACR